MVYLQATLKIYQGQMENFCQVMAGVVPIVEERGWKLLAAYQNLIGRQNTIVDIWEIPDANSVEKVLGAVSQLTAFRSLVKELNGVVEEEVLQVMTKASYSH
jgi:predicted transcriptional regulator